MAIDSPIQAKAKLVEILREKIKEFTAYFTRQGIDIKELENTVSPLLRTETYSLSDINPNHIYYGSLPINRLKTKVPGE